MLKILNSILMLVLMFGLVACSTSPDADDPTAEMTAQEIYAEARQYMENAEYESAIEYFEKLESRFPYGAYATQAILEMAYAYYKYDEPESAILEAERFIKLHPDHPSVDYAYYLRALARYQSELSFMARWFDQKATERDPKSAREAFRFFSELVNRFPKSRYTPDAILRMYSLRDGLARYELHVASYYNERQAYVAAAKRAQYVVKNYQGTKAVPEALAVMVEAYVNLELPVLAKDALRVLEMNFPDYQRDE
ncbi:MAG: outer membrane protein assembly factor BamD [Gammaproteobacteria bacterium]|nr:outer membrane protein assembly factor BamD [Gammaproteobacteria bacterium]